MLPSPSAGSGGVGGGSPSNHPPPSSSSSPSFWCHQCESTVTLPNPSPPLICPHCGGDFLEETPQSEPHHRPRRRRHDLHQFAAQRPHYIPPHDFDDGDFSGFLSLGRNSSPYQNVFEHLLRQVDDASATFAFDISGGPSPAPKSSIDAIPAVQVTAEFLADDPSLLCAVCKDEFALGTEAKRLPCSHIYHGDCIIPWLSQHNSCPVCRFQLPTDGNDQADRRRRRTLFRRARDWTAPPPLMVPNSLEEGDVVSFLEMGGMISQIARRNHMFDATSPLPMVSGELATVSPTQMAEAEVGSVGPANSVETVSSGWHVDGASSVGGAGGGERLDDEN